MLKKEKIFLIVSCIFVFILSQIIVVFLNENIKMSADASWYLFCYAFINIGIFINIGRKSLLKFPKDKVMWIIVIFSTLWMCYMAFGLSIMNMDYAYYKAI